MLLEEIQKHWEAFGETDPLWAIMSDGDKRNGRWDLADFFGTGERQIADRLARVASRGIEVRRGKALDFGCGVGRLTQALADRFETAVGVDISAPMLERARSYNRHGDRCRYVLNTKNDLKVFEDNTFDFVFSTIVLQHMAPEHAKNYIREFVRVLAPGGVLIFQIPSRPEVITPSGPAGEAAPSRPRPITASASALPDSGFNVHISVPHPPVVVAAGGYATFGALVQNRGDVTWPALGDPDATNGRARINLGNHWLDGDGNMVMFDDQRFGLPHDLEPGQEAVIPCAVPAPKAPGSYLLELDMVQEYVSWFATKGSETARIKVRVTPEAEAFEAKIIMNSVPKDEVIEILESGGVRLFSEDEFSDSEWIHVYYYGVK